MAGVAAADTGCAQCIPVEHVIGWLEQAVEREVRVFPSEDHPQNRVDMPEFVAVAVRCVHAIEVTEEVLHVDVDVDVSGFRLQASASLTSVACRRCDKSGEPLLELVYYLSPAEVSRA